MLVYYAFLKIKILHFKDAKIKELCKADLQQIHLKEIHLSTDNIVADIQLSKSDKHTLYDKPLFA